MSIWKKPLKLGILLTIFSINCYAASSLEVVKPEINKIYFSNGTWRINYDELKNGTNLLKEELFVDRNSDRVVTIGTEEKREFPLQGTYAEDSCHKAYVVVYDKAHNFVTKSDVYKFGDTSKCNLPAELVKPEINKIYFSNGTWRIDYDELKNGTNLLKEELFVDGNSDRVVTIGTEEKREFPLQGTYSEDSCHKAYVVVYDKAHSIVTKSDVFEFGDMSKCGFENIAPIAIAGDDKTVTVNTAVTLTGRATDSDGTISAYEWKEGSDVLATIASFTHTFTTLGEHNLTLFVTDDDGAVGSDSVMITVKDIVIVSSKVKKTGQTKSYDQVGNEVNNGSVKDDGYYQKGVTSSYTRDDAKEIVTDNVTHLQWQDNSEAKRVSKNWDGANTNCSELTLGGYNDWRLPTRKELFGIVDFGRYTPSIDTSKFKNVSTSNYWSAPKILSDPNYIHNIYFAWVVNFNTGYVNYYTIGNTSIYVRCVRAEE